MTARRLVEDSKRGPKSGQVSQEFTVVTAAPSSPMARALVALALAGSAATLGFGATAAWADGTPNPGVVTTDPVAADPPPDGPATQPTIGSWIIGGTALDGTAGTTVVKPGSRPAVKPVAQSAVKPVAQPAVKPAVSVAAVPVAGTDRATTTRLMTAATSRATTTRAAAAGAARTIVRTAPSTTTNPAAGTTPDGARALPFTGGHVDELLPIGIAVLLSGVVLTLASRPRRRSALA
ncbi:MAG: hypothetical protein NVSMB55_25110 [Mycobacteriales bacterium]